MGKNITGLCEILTIVGGVVVITIAQLHSTKPGLSFCAKSNPACGVLEICDSQDI